MNAKEFIEQYYVIKDKDNNIHHIKLKDYQIKFIEWYEETKKKTGNVPFCCQSYRSRTHSFI